jgi:hypothetical protein
MAGTSSPLSVSLPRGSVLASHRHDTTNDTARNVLVTKDMRGLLSDFGLSRLVSDTSASLHTHTVGNIRVRSTQIDALHAMPHLTSHVGVRWRVCVCVCVCGGACASCASCATTVDVAG